MLQMEMEKKSLWLGVVEAAVERYGFYISIHDNHGRILATSSSTEFPLTAFHPHNA